jgi:hypothetical protein
MGKPNALKALPPAWFRFTDPEDQALYGDRWFVFKEADMLRLRARELIALETDLGMPIVAVMNGFRESTALGDTAAAWMGVRAADLTLAGEFDQFNCVTNMIEWTATPPEPDPKDEPAQDLPVPEAWPSTMTVPSANTTSVPTDTVALQTLPIAEWPTS